MITGTVMDRTYREGDTFEPASLEERPMQYLYKEGDHYQFMDNQTYEQIMIGEEALGMQKIFSMRKFFASPRASSPIIICSYV